jgi:UDP-glucose 4-epimerase
MKHILVTGGAGYIGTHTLVELDEAGYDFVVYDNLSNSSKRAIQRVEQIIGKPVRFVQGDIRDAAKLDEVFGKYEIDAVIHFAGLKAVGESVAKPLEYYDNNVNGTLVLLEAMKRHGCKKIVFSSSATVYGDPDSMPIREDFPVGATTNPYGTSKYMIERILEDLVISDETNEVVILRYFNPVGAHESGLIGEDPSGIPNNLMPYITQTAVGQLSCLSVFGDDYDTHDGTGVRDYIHVVDLAKAHVKALDFLSSEFRVQEDTIRHSGLDPESPADSGEILNQVQDDGADSQTPNPLIVNLGTGTGYSVLDMVHAFERATGREVNYCIAPRRPGDIAVCYADPGYAKEILGWEAKRGIEEMCRDGWRWQEMNPEGF